MSKKKYDIMTNRACIDLDNLSYNLEQIKTRVDPCQVMAVVKADAYGHGVIPVAKRLVKEGVQNFAVARLNEALELINNGIDHKILIFGRLFPQELAKAIQENIRITLTTKDDIAVIAQKAQQLNQKARLHINIDTGMGRTGLLYNQASAIIAEAVANPNLEVEGLYSHFSTADMADKSYAQLQFERFEKLLDELQEKHIEIPYIHMANGGAMLDIPASYQGRFNMVRAGILLYGYYPTLETSQSMSLKQVMTLKSRVLELRRVPANSSISYGRRYTTAEEMKIAVLPIGYADGIHRSFTNKARVLINGKLYPIVGTVTMDQIMVAVDEDVQEGDDVIFWGNAATQDLRASQVADQVGTIAYELTCAVSPRVPKVYNKKCNK